MEVRNTRCHRAGATYVLPFPGGCSNVLVSISFKKGGFVVRKDMVGLRLCHGHSWAPKDDL